MTEPTAASEPPACCGKVPGSFKNRPIGNACQLCPEPPAAAVFWRNRPGVQARLDAADERFTSTGSYLQ